MNLIHQVFELLLLEVAQDLVCDQQKPTPHLNNACINWLSYATYMDLIMLVFNHLGIITIYLILLWIVCIFFVWVSGKLLIFRYFSSIRNEIYTFLSTVNYNIETARYFFAGYNNIFSMIYIELRLFKLPVEYISYLPICHWLLIIMSVV